jgi:hypothetical protein
VPLNKSFALSIEVGRWIYLWRVVYKCFLPAAVKGLEGEGGHVMCDLHLLILFGYHTMLSIEWDPQTQTTYGEEPASNPLFRTRLSHVTVVTPSMREKKSL